MCMAFLKGNTYVDGDLIVDGDITVGSLSSKGVAFTQLIDPQDNYVALTTSSGNLTPSTIRETIAADGTATYSLNSISAVDTDNNPLTINSSSVTINTAVDKITTAPASGQLYWEYSDGATYSAATYPTGARPGTSNPAEYPTGVKLV